MFQLTRVKSETKTGGIFFNSMFLVQNISKLTVKKFVSAICRMVVFILNIFSLINQLHA